MIIREPVATKTTDSDIKPILDTFVKNRINSMDTIVIGLILKFYPDTQTADVRPVINRWKTYEENGETVSETMPQPIYPQVPVIFPSGGDWALTFPVKAGDECVLMAIQRDTSNWREVGGVVDPQSKGRSYSFKDAVAFVGLNSKATALPQFNSSEPEIRNRTGSVKLTMTSSGMTLKGNLNVEGDISTLTGNVIAGTTGLKTHVHAVTTAPGTTAIGVG